MPPSTPMLDAARRFLALRRFALVGVSRNEKEFSRAVLRALLAHGYDVVPVSPVLSAADGFPSHPPRLQAIRPAVTGALVVAPREQAVAIAQDCIEAGVRMVWFHRGQGPGSATPSAVELLRTNGIEVVTDLCPFMAFPDASWPHRVHRFFRLRRAARQP